jgi:hypothetical protein
MSAPPSSGSARPRHLILAGALVTAAGLAVAATAPIVGTAPAPTVHPQQELGGAVVLVGWALLAYAIHRLGRSDPPDPDANLPR